MKIKGFNMKKLKIFQIVLALVFVLFFIFLFSAKNYTKEYTVNDIKVKETFNKDKKSYYFTFVYNDITLDYLVKSGYKQHRGFIDNIEVIEDDDNFCLIPKSSKFEIKPLCYQNKTITHYTHINKTLKEKLKLTTKTNKKISTFNDIEIYNNDHNYLIWNYDGFYYLNKDENKKIDILNKELYTISLIGYTEDYLVIADYDSNYTFNKFYTIDFKNGNLKKYDLDRSIYFDSYFIGYEKNKIYIVDNKESLMYEFNAKNGKLEKISSKYLNQGNWENIAIKKLVNKKQEFTYITNYNYTLEDKTIYLNYKDQDIKTLVANDVTALVRVKDQDIYYLKNDSLYHFNPENGETLLLTYFEWNFNYENMIYIN